MNCAINDVLECIEVEQTNSAEVRAQEVNKKHVAEHFSAACGNYDHYAQVQKQIAEVNLELLSHVIAGRSKFSVDLGCGTGLHTSLLAKMSDNCLAIDISHGMLKVAQINNTDMTTATNNAILYCSGDADSLPLQSQSIDVLHSSMALQWCSSPSFAIAEIARVLSTSGSAQLAIMLDSSLYELRDAWENIGITPRINNFFSQQQWLQATQDLQIEQINQNSNVKINIQQQVRSFTEWHSSSLDMLRALKLIGAATKYNSKQIGKNSQLQLSPVTVSTAISKQELIELDKQMQRRVCGLSEQYQQRNAGDKGEGNRGLPLTYQILFLTIQKKQS
ncbi:methyltransferase domain-containing protein [Brumicola pallidula]|jgi:malonyl-CoA O-methyltransferase|uniref:Malonyl-CoA O-methyltransferase n=1 Tax=Brumicola pallidula DSM 14239 = ACAM 615 TaxID=1121922 RepID=K6Z2L7_9ALTE|nr:methyltransferase domain-containing protein [Glaciecola pallidula]GAC30456.1 malonyl-CoA O-methyltransferase [Glaciecola pallidula DSM 14239 = ACAM 615]